MIPAAPTSERLEFAAFARLRSGAQAVLRAAWPPRRWAVPGVALLLLLLALRALHGELAAYSYRGATHALRSIPSAQLLGALLWTAMAFAVLPLYDLLALEFIGRLRIAGDLTTSEELRTRGIGIVRGWFGGIVAYAISQLLGFPALTGSAVRYRMWSGWGLTTPEISRAAAYVGLAFTFGLASVSGLALLFEPSATALILPLAPGSARALGVALLCVVGLSLRWALILARRTSSAPRRTLAYLLPGVSLLDWATAAAALWVLLPPDVRPPFGAFAGLFVVAQVFGIASHIPGGLGVFDAAIIVGLKPHAPLPSVVAALLAFRVVYYVVPFAGAVLALACYEWSQRIALLRAVTSASAQFVRTVGERVHGTKSLARSFGHFVVPTVVAAAVFLAGAVLLLSGATPSSRARVTALQILLPTSVMEVSHLLGSVAGALLLVLAWALRRRLDAAWTLTVLLLCGGMVASILKGLDWEEALLLLAVLAVVLPFRRAFYRRTALSAEPFEPGWIMAILAVIGLTTWIGLLSFRHVDLAGDVWWRFRPHADAPRFLRATLATAVVLSMLAFARLLRPTRAVVTRPSEPQLARAARIATACRFTESHLALLGDKALLFASDATASTVPAPDGFVQYGVAGQSWIAMGDPMVADASSTPAGSCAPEVAAQARRQLAWQFKSTADAHGGRPVFYEVSHAMLPTYIDLGLTFVKLGEMARVELPSFSLDGGGRKSLRRAVKDVEQAGARFEVITPADVPIILAELESISSEWLNHKHAREKGFSLGYFDAAYLQRGPVAVVRRAGVHGGGDEIVAFANLWIGGDREELSADLMRFSRRAPKGVMDFLFVKIMQWGKANGFRSFNMGMAPLAGLEGGALAPLWSQVGSWLYRHGEHFYKYRGLRQYKEKFDPTWEPRYLASPGGVALPRILMQVTSLISGGLAGVVRR